MVTGRCRFNIYLLLAVATLFASGCQTSKKKKEKATTLAIHIEVQPTMMDFSTAISVLREHPISLHIDKSPFLTEIDVADAKVIDVVGGFALELEFTRRG